MLASLRHCNVVVVEDPARSHRRSATSAAEQVPALCPYKSRLRKKTIRKRPGSLPNNAMGPSIASGYPRPNRCNVIDDRWRAEVITAAATTPALALPLPPPPPLSMVSEHRPHGAPLGYTSQHPTYKLLTNTHPMSTNASQHNALHNMRHPHSIKHNDLSPLRLQVAPSRPRRQPSRDDMLLILSQDGHGTTDDLHDSTSSLPLSPSTASPRRPLRQKSGQAALSALSSSTSVLDFPHHQHSPTPRSPHPRKVTLLRRGGGGGGSRLRPAGMPTSSPLGKLSEPLSATTASQMLKDALALCSLDLSSHNKHHGIPASSTASNHLPVARRSGDMEESSDESTVGSLSSTTYSDDSDS
jgi:hypothetical protein